MLTEKKDGRKNNGGHSTAGRKPLPTIEIHPRVMPETDSYLQAQINEQAKTKGQVLDAMVRFCADSGFMVK